MKTYLAILAFGVISCAPTLPTYEVLFSGNSIDVPAGYFDNSSINVVTDPNAPFDILLVKDSPGAHALYLRCTHDQKPLDPTPSEIVCPVCGSVYDFDGVVKSGPAERDLDKFLTELSADQSLIRINIEPLNR